MAQPAHCVRSTFGLQCCLLILRASWEAGAITFQVLQKTGDSPASDHLFPPTSGLVYSTPSDHIALHSGHSPLDLSKSTETHKLKHHCNTTHRFKPTYNPIDNSQNSTSHQEVPPTSEKNPSNQGKDPNVQNEHSVDPTDSTNTHKGWSGTKHSITAPKTKTACTKTNKNKTGPGNQHKTVTPSGNINTRAHFGSTYTKIGNINTTLDSKSITSHKTISPVHNAVSLESNKILTPSSGKSITATDVSYEATRTPEMSKRAEDHKTVASSRNTVASGKTVMKTTEHINRTTSAIEKTTQMPATLTINRHKTTSAHINITRSLGNPVENGKVATLPYKKNPGVPAEPTKHGEETKSTDEKTTTTKEKSKKHGQNSTPSSRKTTRASEESKDHGGKTTRAPEGSKDHGEKTTLANGKTTRAPEGSKDHGEKTTGALEGSKDHGGKTTRAPEGSKDHGGKTTGAPEGSKDHGEKTTRANGKTTRAPEG
uniref:mucin-like protein 3 n=1 Tax=Halichoerus grypus TaxID=9711 RepID=UPI001659F3DE